MKSKPLNSQSDRLKLAAAIVQSASYLENHVRFDRKEHNFEMFYAFVDAAGKVGSK